MTQELLCIDGLQAGYGKIQILWDINLTINSGEIVALVGSNGAGKTTLLRALSCVIPSKGSVVFEGRQINGLSPESVFSLGLVQVPEGRQLFALMTVEENMLMGCFHETDRAKIALNLERVYSLFPLLKERRRQSAGSLSGGEQQMCAIARGLMSMPRLLLVDEMSLGLAPVMVDILVEALLEVRKEDVTILLVEQDVYTAFQFSDRGYVLENGKIVQTGKSSDLTHDPEIQRAYFGI